MTGLKFKSNTQWAIIDVARLNLIAVFSRMRGNKFSERLAVQDSNTTHLCDYCYIFHVMRCAT